MLCMARCQPADFSLHIQGLRKQAQQIIHELFMQKEVAIVSTRGPPVRWPPAWRSQAMPISKPSQASHKLGPQWRTPAQFAHTISWLGVPSSSSSEVLPASLSSATSSSGSASGSELQRSLDPGASSLSSSKRSRGGLSVEQTCPAAENPKTPRSLGQHRPCALRGRGNRPRAPPVSPAIPLCSADAEDQILQRCPTSGAHPRTQKTLRKDKEQPGLRRNPNASSPKSLSPATKLQVPCWFPQVSMRQGPEVPEQSYGHELKALLGHLGVGPRGLSNSQQAPTHSIGAHSECFGGLLVVALEEDHPKAASQRYPRFVASRHMQGSRHRLWVRRRQRVRRCCQCILRSVLPGPLKRRPPHSRGRGGVHGRPSQTSQGLAQGSWVAWQR